MDYFGARYYDSRLGFWTSVDPLADDFINQSPYLYCSGNPIVRIDPDGRADFYDADGNHLCNDGVDDKKVFQQSEQGERVLGGYAIPFTEIGEVERLSFSYNGEMVKGKNQSAGQLTVTQHVGDKEFNQQFDAVSGGPKLYTLQNGEYSCSTIKERYKSEANGGYYNNGVGFSIVLTPQFSTERTYLRIHPDGGYPGTAGCIGLTGTASELKQFLRTVQTPLTQGIKIPLIVNIPGNPSCCKAATTTSPAKFQNK